MFWQNFLDRMIRLRATRARRDGAKLTELGEGNWRLQFFGIAFQHKPRFFPLCLL